MGDVLTSNGPPKLSARIIGTAPISRIDLIRNNEFLYSVQPERKEHVLDYVDSAAKKGESYYYLRVTQQDGNLAWSSPLWITVR
ncbi:MAG: hypothetical protein HYZ37_05120 [Candidatus Solibacter usitatus]|nr:hypothetical protein [Candidatus Solibacter usitatus]